MKRLPLILSLILPIALTLAACAPPTREQQVIDDAAQALGGASRIKNLKALTIQGTGTAPNAGQNRTPDDELPVWKVNEFTRTIDLPNVRMRAQQVREAQFLFAGDLVQRQIQGMDGDAAYTVSASGSVTRAGGTAARDRRIEFLHHPIAVVRTILDAEVTLNNLKAKAGERLVDVTMPGGEAFMLAIDAKTHLPTRVVSMVDNPNMGDVAIETRFSDYEDVDGLKLPRRLTTRMDQYPQFDLQVSKNAIDGDTASLAIPADLKKATAPDPPAMVVTAEPVGTGIWWLAGSGNHRSVVFEFDDHLVLFEAPLNEARTKATFEFMDDRLTLKDKSMEVQLYYLLDNPREGTNIYAYVPRDRMLVQADLYDATWLRHSWGENVLQNLAKRGLKPDKSVPVHGILEPFTQMVANIESKPR